MCDSWQIEKFVVIASPSTSLKHNEILGVQKHQNDHFFTEFDRYRIIGQLGIR